MLEAVSYQCCINMQLAMKHYLLLEAGLPLKRMKQMSSLSSATQNPLVVTILHF